MSDLRKALAIVLVQQRTGELRKYIPEVCITKTHENIYQITISYYGRPPFSAVQFHKTAIEFVLYSESGASFVKLAPVVRKCGGTNTTPMAIYVNSCYMCSASNDDDVVLSVRGNFTCPITCDQFIEICETLLKIKKSNGSVDD